ncbi:MAG TPA: Nuclease subunit of the excinuclease complex [Cyanothece sp. UBA12306]|nr:Nuclease subunit of the excinuclease complex [Cyanothece sp. UBA12306]
MTTQPEIIHLNNLDYLPYLDDNGLLSEELSRKIGVYAIFDQDKNLQFVGYSRDIYLSLKQHLVRQPKKCYWLKIQTIARPSRTILENIQQSWLQEYGITLSDNNLKEVEWIDPIDTKDLMTEEEKKDYQKADEMSQIKLLKKIARKFEAQLQENLKQRGSQVEIRFNPKLKERGLLDLK